MLRHGAAGGDNENVAVSYVNLSFRYGVYQFSVENR